MNFLDLGSWANVATAAVPVGALYSYWRAKKDKSLHDAINRQTEHMRDNQSKFMDLVKENIANQAKLSTSIDNLNSTITNLKIDTLKQFNKHDIKLENHESRIENLEKENR